MSSTSISVFISFPSLTEFAMQSLRGRECEFSLDEKPGRLLEVGPGTFIVEKFYAVSFLPRSDCCFSIISKA